MALETAVFSARATTSSCASALASCASAASTAALQSDRISRERATASVRESGLTARPRAPQPGASAEKDSPTGEGTYEPRTKRRWSCELPQMRRRHRREAHGESRVLTLTSLCDANRSRWLLSLRGNRVRETLNPTPFRPQAIGACSPQAPAGARYHDLCTGKARVGVAHVRKQPLRENSTRRRPRDATVA